MELICVRHGRTAWNAGRRFQGQTDIALDAEGRAQAMALGALLASDRFDAAVSSDLSRAAETARIVLADRPIELRLDPDWREMQFGAWEGLTWEQIVAADPASAGANSTSVRDYAPRGGETFDQLCARIARAVDRAVAVAEDASVLVATHAGPLHALLSVLLGDDEPIAVRFATASVTRFRRDAAGTWTLARLNQTALSAS